MSGHTGIDSIRFIISFSNSHIRGYDMTEDKKTETLKMTLDIDLPGFAPALMNLADFLYARVKGIIMSDQL